MEDASEASEEVEKEGVRVHSLWLRQEKEEEEVGEGEGEGEADVAVGELWVPQEVLPRISPAAHFRKQ